MNQQWRSYFSFVFVMSSTVCALTCLAETFDWEGASSSIATKAMAGAGLTNPITETLLPWASSKSADESWIAENSTMASRILEGKGRFEVGSLKVENSGAFGSFEASSPQFIDLDALRSEIVSHPNELNQSRVDLATRYFEKGLATSFTFSKRRLAVSDASGGIDLKVSRDFQTALAVSGPIFEKENAGRLEFGTAVKAIYRNGDHVFWESASVNQSILSSEFSKSAFAAGLDYGLLYSLPKKWTKQLLVQAALSWKDVGSTQFFVGNSTSIGRRFEALPNNQSFGVGVGSPNIWRGFGAVLRLEYREWKRDISFWKKNILAIELRAPEVLSVYAGTRGNLWSAGLALRFPHIELSLASYASLFGEASTTYSTRCFAMEMKSVF